MSTLSEFKKPLSSLTTFKLHESGTTGLFSHGGSDYLLYVRDTAGYVLRSGVPLDNGVNKVQSDFFYTFKIDEGMPDSAGPEYVKNTIATPPGSPSGITVDQNNDRLIHSDVDADLINVHAGFSSTIDFSFASPGGSCTGLAFHRSTGNLVSCDSSTGSIYVHDGVSSTILSSFSTGLSIYEYGVTITDEGDLALCDYSGGSIYVFDGISASIKKTIPSPTGSTSGIAFDFKHNNLISLSQDTKTINTHLGTSSTIIDSFQNSSINRGLGYSISEGTVFAAYTSSNSITQFAFHQRPYAAIEYITQEI